MEQPESIQEMRRHAPLHYWLMAQNARFAAYAIQSMDREARERCAEQLGYVGDLDQAFCREASVALELVIKAVIAQQHVTKVRTTTHDLVSLWCDAELPSLPPDDEHRLMIAKELLYWEGRYAAPSGPEADKLADAARKKMALLKDTRPFGSMRLTTMGHSFGWDDFDRIYQVAAISFRDHLPA
jgi:HEPN domain-containing protein